MLIDIYRYYYLYIIICALLVLVLQHHYIQLIDLLQLFYNHQILLSFVAFNL